MSTHCRYGAAQFFQYSEESISLKWAGGDLESGIADYEVAVVETVASMASDDGGTLMVPTSTHRLNYFTSVRVGAIGDSPQFFYRIRAYNKFVFVLHRL